MASLDRHPLSVSKGCDHFQLLQLFQFPYPPLLAVIFLAPDQSVSQVFGQKMSWISAECSWKRLRIVKIVLTWSRTVLKFIRKNGTFSGPGSQKNPQSTDFMFFLPNIVSGFPSPTDPRYLHSVVDEFLRRPARYVVSLMRKPYVVRMDTLVLSNHQSRQMLANCDKQVLVVFE